VTTDDAGTAQLDDELEAAARAVLDAHEALLRARGRRDRALAAYVVRGGFKSPAASVHARSTLIGRALTDEQIRLVGVSEPTIQQAARHARSLSTL
jgi:hypothetical protein